MDAALLAWYRRFGRDLPWRHTRDPYAILVSEVMLQQTLRRLFLAQPGRLRDPIVAQIASHDQ